ncbi:hypothetical protein F5050DRAFT_1571589, partial [Lentinula boryana]
ISEGGTVAPIIIASNKTQLTQFLGNEAAYLVYLTIGNILKSLRHKPNAKACILIAYLSVDKISMEGIMKSAFQLCNYKLFHISIKAAGDPLPGGMMMVGGDGAVRKVYPILTTYVADYPLNNPEQCLVTCAKYRTCPKCQQSADELQSPTPVGMRTQRWTLEVIKARTHGKASSDQVYGE